MDIICNPPRESWQALSRRALAEKAAELEASVAGIIAEVADGGDKALLDFERRFTGATLDSLEVSAQELDEAETKVSPELRDAIEIAYRNIASFHAA